MNTITLTKQESAQLLAAWLAENMPELYVQLAQRAGSTAPPQLSGITDMLRSIGSGIATAARSVASGLSTGVKSVGNLLTTKEGVETLTSLATVYAQTQAQKDALKVQVAQAQAGQPPQAIQTVYDPATGVYTPVFAPPGSQPQVMTPQLANRLMPNFFQQYGPWIFGFGVAAVALAIYLRR